MLYLRLSLQPTNPCYLDKHVHKHFLPVRNIILRAFTFSRFKTLDISQI